MIFINLMKLLESLNLNTLFAKRALGRVTLLLTLVCGLTLSGCSVPGMNRLSSAEAEAVQSIYLTDEFNQSVQHMTLHLDAFDSSKFEVSAPEIYEKLNENFKAELIDRGYKIADSLANSDFGITLSGFKVKNDESPYGIDGAGFFVDGRTFLYDLRPSRRWIQGVVAQAAIKATLIDPLTGKSRTSSSSEIKIPTGLRIVVGSWEEYSAGDKSFLLSELSDALFVLPA